MLKQFLGSFRVRVLAVWAGVWAVLFAGAGWTSYQVVRRALERSVNEHLLASASFVAAEAGPWLPRTANIEPGSRVDPRLRAVLDKALSSGIAKDIVLLDSRGLVLLDATGEAAPGFPSEGLGPGERSLLGLGRGLALEPRRDSFGALHQAVFVPSPKGPILRLDADPRQLQVLDAYRSISVALGAVGVVLCALVGALAAGWVLRPVEWMTQAAQGTADGGSGSDAVALAGRDDELGRAARAVAGSLRSLEAERIEARLRRAMAERSSLEWNQVARAIAHEVRNPLAVIRGQADLLQRLLAEPTADPLLERVRAQVDHLDRVIGRFLELGRTPRLELSRLFIPDLMRYLIDSLHASKLGAAWTVIDEGAPPIHILGDAALLEGALLNLGLNALQAMPQGGAVHVGAEVRQGSLCLALRDEGPGLDSSTRARLFEPFFTTKAGGNGLGLALARRTAEAHGGELRLLDSDEGACFGLFLPLDEGG